MNREYQLIKEYPGSPVLNTKVYNSDCKEYYCRYDAEKSSFYRCHLIENKPEFWKLVEPILNYKVLLWSYGYNHEHTTSYDPYEELRDYNIYKVQRLSDKTVWTVGDIHNSKAITSFEDLNGSLKVWCGSSETWISALMTKEKVFTTTDGVDIYDGNAIVYVPFYDFTKITTSTANEVVADFKSMSNRDVYIKDSYPAFSTKELAEKFIILNKTSLSLMEVINAATEPDFIDRLEELIKLKSK